MPAPARRSWLPGGLVVWLAAGLLAAALLTVVPLDWGIAYSQTAPPPAAPSAPEPPPPAPVPVIAPLPADAVGTQFASFTRSRNTIAALGRPLSRPMAFAGMAVQYFEKNRVEDHSAYESDPGWKVMYGLLVHELVTARSAWPIGGEESTLSYAELAKLAGADRRQAPPADFGGGIAMSTDGSAFIPYDARLRPASGHQVPARFWTFMQRVDMFPGGWLHDLGLPVTAVTNAVVRKGDLAGRPIEIQAFQRGIITFDLANPEGWQVELANVGTDYALTFPGQVFANGQVAQ